MGSPQTGLSFQRRRELGAGVVLAHYNWYNLSEPSKARTVRDLQFVQTRACCQGTADEKTLVALLPMLGALKFTRELCSTSVQAGQGT